MANRVTATKFVSRRGFDNPCRDRFDAITRRSIPIPEGRYSTGLGRAARRQAERDRRHGVQVPMDKAS